MAPSYEDQKKRPTPISIPPHPLPRAIPWPCSPDVEYKAGRSSQPQQQLVEPFAATSASDRSRASADATVSNKVDQTYGISHKSDYGSTVSSAHVSTQHSKQSGYSHQSAKFAQAQLEALDEEESKETVRGKIEARMERRMAEKAGQTPAMTAEDERNPQIVVDDLRQQCRDAQAAEQRDYDEPIKSPKKTILGNIRNVFSKSTSNVPMPSMPPKAAQVLGLSERIPNKVKIYPIKPTRSPTTPTKLPRSDTVKSLPAKIVSPQGLTQRHHGGPALRSRIAKRSSPQSNKYASNASATPSLPKAPPMFEPMFPPTPPAKDTPPDSRIMASVSSPLRRTYQFDDLRENFVKQTDAALTLPFPEFALSPLPPKTAIPAGGGASPTKFRPYTAEDYTQLIAGQAFPWPLADEKSFTREDEDQANNPFSDRLRPEYPPRDQSLLAPRFYSPLDRCFRPFAEGETPSKNSDTNRLLFSVPSNPNQLYLHDSPTNVSSKDGSIKMVYRGNLNDIEQGSSTDQLLRSGEQVQTQFHGDTQITSRIMKELRISDPTEPARHSNGVSGHIQLDKSSSRLTDMLHDATPHRNNYGREFDPNCPSAVPSPLHSLPGPITPSQPVKARPVSFGIPKNIEDHFYMTNEHLDVVGKTTWDRLESSKKQLLAAINVRNEVIAEAAKKLANDNNGTDGNARNSFDHINRTSDRINDSLDDMKSQLTTLNEKAGRVAEKQDKVHNEVDQIWTFVKMDIAAAFAAQEDKTSQLEGHIKELHITMQAFQKSIEQKIEQKIEPKPIEPKPTLQQSSNGSYATPTPANSAYPPQAHRFPPSLTGYYSNPNDFNRVAQPPMPQIHDTQGLVSQQENQNIGQAGYNNGHGQQWGARTAYPGRSNKEDRTAHVGTNPYYFANGGGYNAGFNGSYGPHVFSPSPPDTHYNFNQGPANTFTPGPTK